MSKELFSTDGEKFICKKCQEVYDTSHKCKGHFLKRFFWFFFVRNSTSLFIAITVLFLFSYFLVLKGDILMYFIYFIPIGILNGVILTIYKRVLERKLLTMRKIKKGNN